MSVDKTLVEDLKYRGLWKQLTHENELVARMRQDKPIHFYVGFDPTAPSLHVGHLLGLVTMARFQAAGHRPLALCGGGTGLIGDPSGKSELRSVLTAEVVDANIARMREQMGRLLDFKNERSRLVNNGDWIRELNYVSFIRDVGSHFTVNRMLQAECFKSRMETGLTFIEFNYMILQAYDFYHLHQKYDCCLQIGGDDQWSNIIAGVELIRRKLQKPAFGLTYPLLLTSDGKKMGKTESGAVWLDAEKTSPYDFFQYWRNVEDSGVITLLKQLTFLSHQEIDTYAACEGQALNEVKIRLAYELTTMVHGVEAAKRAQESASALFSGGAGNNAAMPTSTFTHKSLQEGYGLLEALMACGAAASKGEARRTIDGNAIAVNDVKIKDQLYKLTLADLNGDGEIIIRKGKKKFYKWLVE